MSYWDSEYKMTFVNVCCEKEVLLDYPLVRECVLPLLLLPLLNVTASVEDQSMLLQIVD